MTSGRKLTIAVRMSILRWHEVGKRWSEIAKLVDLDYRTVQSVVCEAARDWYREHKPRRVDDLQDGPTA